MILYHGSNDSNIFPTIRAPRSGNTPGFYLTPDENQARNYGVHLYKFEIPNDCQIKFIIRELGDTGTTEWIVSNKKDLNELLDYEI